jgi:hypothetical protein
MLCTVLHRGVCSSVASATPAGELSVVERDVDLVGLIWSEDLGCLSDNICGCCKKNQPRRQLSIILSPLLS